MLLNSTAAKLTKLKEQLPSLYLPLESIITAETRAQNIQWQMLRLDLLDDDLSGNKLFKLLPYLEKAQAEACKTLISFGGRHSNHLHALAHACQRFGFNCVAMVRGYEEQGLTPTLRDLYQLGVEVHFLSRQDYRKRYEVDFQQQILECYEKAMLIEEGGNGELGMQGMELLAKQLEQSLPSNTDYIILPSGTGCCFFGLLSYLPDALNSKILAVLAVKNVVEMQQKLASMPTKKGVLIDGYQFGGFGKQTAELLNFMVSFEQQHGIPLDPVYTGKMCFAIDAMLKQQYFKPNSRIVSLHTGGLQGARSL